MTRRRQSSSQAALGGIGDQFKRVLEQTIDDEVQRTNIAGVEQSVRTDSGNKDQGTGKYDATKQRSEIHLHLFSAPMAVRLIMFADSLPSKTLVKSEGNKRAEWLEE